MKLRTGAPRAARGPSGWALGVVLLIFLLGVTSLSIGILVGYFIWGGNNCGELTFNNTQAFQCEALTPVAQAIEQIDLSAAMISISSLVANGSNPEVRGS